jgi:uracil-DNA glycosylase family 4
MHGLNKEKSFDKLLNSVCNCDLCERMCDRRKVLSKYNGNLNSKVMFIAEAPGRLGAECTGIPLYGDKTGSNFENLLGNIGWRREDIFISNAILCNPQDEKGNNATPTSDEIANCSYYLEMLINIVNPDVIVTLGIKALDALKYIETHQYVLKECVGKSFDWHGRKLFPLYHMGPRATIHRALTQQRADFIKLQHLVSPENGLKKKNVQHNVNTKAMVNDKLSDMIMLILSQFKDITFFKLTKLLYLSDLSFLEKYKSTISGCVYLRMQEGPWIPTLKNTTMSLSNYVSTYYINKKPYLKLNKIDLDKGIDSLSPEEKEMIISVCHKYYSYDDAKIKLAAYMTKPMKYIIKNEKVGRNMTKIPVLYKDSTVIDNDMNKVE